MLEHDMKQLLLVVLLLWMLAALFWNCEALQNSEMVERWLAVVDENTEMLVSIRTRFLSRIKKEILKDPGRLLACLAGVGRGLCVAGHCFILGAAVMTVCVLRGEEC